MFSIFNGKSRGLGEQPKNKVHMRVSVQFREYLHYFKGAQLAVFIAIALHADDQGWSSPTIKQLKSETGYEPGTISAALTGLCSVVIEDKRVLFAEQLRSKGRFVKNRYLIFPSAEEIAEHEETERKSRTQKPALGTVHKKSNTAEPSTDQSNTENRVDGINHIVEEPYMDNTKDSAALAAPAEPIIAKPAQVDPEPPTLNVVLKEPLPSSDMVALRPTQSHMLPIEAWCKRLSKTQPPAFKMGAFARVSQDLHKSGVTADNMDCAALLIQAWIDAHRGAIMLSWEVKAMRPLIDASLSLCRMGLSPGDISAFVKEEKAKDFWKGKSISFDYISKNLPTWKIERAPVAQPELVDDPDHPGSKITPGELRSREAQKRNWEAAYGNKTA